MPSLISKIPLIRFIIPIILGILMAYARLHIHYATGLFVSGILIWISATYINVVPGINRAKYLYIFSIFLTVLAISWINASLFIPQNIDFKDYSRATLVVDEIRNKKRSVQLTCQLLELSGDGEVHREKAEVTLFTKNKGLSVEVGDIIVVPAKFSRIKNIYENNVFDYASYMESKGIIYSQFIMPGKIQVTGHQNSLVTLAHDIQRYLVNRISQSYFISVPARQFIITTLLGDSSNLGRDIRKSFSSTGLSHILAVSGLHVGIIFLLLSIILYPLRQYRKTRYVIIMVTLVIYAFITGLSPSVIRATIMALFLLVSAMLYRRNTSLNALFGSAVFILMFNPLDLFNAGFQLSYLSVLAILLMSDKMNPFPPHKRILYKVGTILSVSLAATAGTCALSVYYFKIFPVSFLITNAVVVPVLPLILGLGIVYLVFPACFTGNLFEGIYKLLIWFVDFINKIPFSSVDITVSAYQVVIYYILLSLLVLWLYFKKKVYISSFFTLGGLTGVYYCFM